MPGKHDFLYNTPDDISEKDYHHNDNIIDAAAKIMKKLTRHDEVDRKSVV